MTFSLQVGQHAMPQELLGNLKLAADEEAAETGGGNGGERTGERPVDTTGETPVDTTGETSAVCADVPQSQVLGSPVSNDPDCSKPRRVLNVHL